MGKRQAPVVERITGTVVRCIPSRRGNGKGLQTGSRLALKKKGGPDKTSETPWRTNPMMQVAFYT
ncbi:MAG: hypothetical protein ACE5GK_01575 [Nitrospiria bacterium]